MARYSAGGNATAVGTTSRAIVSVFGTTASGARIREIGITNDSTTEFDVVIKRLTARGAGPGTALTEGKHDFSAGVSRAEAFHTATVDHTVGDDLGYRATVGAAKGAGIVFTFGDSGLSIPADAAQGIGLLLENGTAQAAQVYIVWDE